jgi:hypothetical protein
MATELTSVSPTPSPLRSTMPPATTRGLVDAMERDLVHLDHLDLPDRSVPSVPDGSPDVPGTPEPPD